MKANKLAFVVAMGALFTSLGSGAFAQDIHSNQISGDHTSHVAPAPKAAKTTKSRSEVRAEARQAASQDIHSNQVSGDHTSHTAK